MTEPLLIDGPGEDGVVLVTLNRPESYNASNHELHKAITDVWPELEKLPGIRSVVLTGAGPAFSAGGDFTLLDNMVRDLDLRATRMTEGADLVRRMVHFPHPIVAAVTGPAVGLGCSLASLSDLVVIEEQAYFMDPHVSLGLVAGDGGVITWPFNMGLQRCKEFLLLGGKMTAQQAFDFGLANRVVAKGESVAEARSLAQRLGDLPPQSLRETRRVLNQPLVDRVEAALADLLAEETKSFDEEQFQANLAKGLARTEARGKA
jgi:enoyl-CoA hydratase